MDTNLPPGSTNQELNIRVAHLEQNMKEIKSDCKAILGKMDDLKNTFNENKFQIFERIDSKIQNHEENCKDSSGNQNQKQVLTINQNKTNTTYPSFYLKTILQVTVGASSVAGFGWLVTEIIKHFAK